MRPVHWTKQLQDIIDQHNNVAALRDKVVSNRTREVRAETLFNSFRDLRNLGYKLQDVKNFRGKHAQALMDHWVGAGLGPGTIQQKWSVIRIYCRWIGKEGMVEDAEKYVRDPQLVTRSYLPAHDKSWTAKAVDPAAMFETVETIAPVIAVALELELAFGLRRRESLMCKPIRADQGNYLSIETNDGPKNGRARMVPIDTDQKRAVIERAKAMVKFADMRLGELLRDRNGNVLRLEQAVNRFTKVLQKCGITKRGLGVTAHGLRHQYANDQYELDLGQASPVRGGEGGSTPETLAARQKISLDLGHTRVSITSAYLGSLKKKKTVDVGAEEELRKE